MHAAGGGRRADGSANSPEVDQRMIRSRPIWAMSAAARWSPGSEVSLAEVDDRRRRSWCDSGEQAYCFGLTAEVAAGPSCGEAFNGAHRRPGEAAHGPLLPGCDSAGDNLSLVDSQTFLRNSLPRAPQTQQRINRARGRSRGKGRDGSLAGALLAFSMVMCLRMETVRALPPAPDHLSVKQVSDSSATITWTAVVGAEAYRLVSASNAPGPYSTFKEYYAAPDEPASNEVTIEDLIEGNMYFLKVHSGTFDGQFESVGSPIAVAIPQDVVRTAVSDVRLEAYGS
ncbi:MAG: fibronectin type III domain-containing protein [Promethearchaeia archaeon]